MAAPPRPVPSLLSIPDAVHLLFKILATVANRSAAARIANLKKLSLNRETKKKTEAIKMARHAADHIQ